MIAALLTTLVLAAPVTEAEIPPCTWVGPETVIIQGAASDSMLEVFQNKGYDVVTFHNYPGKDSDMEATCSQEAPSWFVWLESLWLKAAGVF